MNQFKDKIMKDFEQDLYRCLNPSPADFINVVRQRGDDPIAEFEYILDEHGASALRDHMVKCINTLSVIYQARELGRRMTDEKVAENAQKLGLGLRYQLEN
jgi:hypothetical protein